MRPRRTPSRSAPARCLTSERAPEGYSKARPLLRSKQRGLDDLTGSSSLPPFPRRPVEWRGQAAAERQVVRVKLPHSTTSVAADRMAPPAVVIRSLPDCAGAGTLTTICVAVMDSPRAAFGNGAPGPFAAPLGKVMVVAPTTNRVPVIVRSELAV